jgi:ribonuclease BN (tRNA processing enzyme)
MEIAFLGTNGWFDTETGNTPCVLIKSDEHTILLDAGNGLHKADRYLSGDRPVHLFLSHFHIDHIAGLHILTKFRFPRGLTIYGQPGTRQILDQIIRPPYTVPFGLLPYPVTVLDLEEGDYASPFPIECRYLVHPAPCFGFRFRLDGKVVAYCTDTGFCENAVRLGKNADLLITECAFKSGQDAFDWPHLTPELAIRIARSAAAERLVLMHFDANQYRTIEERRDILRTHGAEFPGLIVAEDGLTIEL